MKLFKYSDYDHYLEGQMIFHVKYTVMKVLLKGEEYQKRMYHMVQVPENIKW